MALISPLLCAFRLLPGLLLLAGCLVGVHVQAGTSNGLMDLSTDGRLLACSNRDSGTVTVVDLQTGEKRSEIAVGRHPEGVTFLGTSHRVAVCVYGDDVVSVLDADTGAVLSRIDVEDEPYGVVSDSAGTRLFVTLEFPGKVIEIDPATASVLQSVPVGKMLRGIARTPAGPLLVTEYLTGVVKRLNSSTLQVEQTWTGSRQENLARQIVAHPQRDKAYLPLQRSVTNVAHGEGSIFPYLSVIDVKSQAGPGRKRIQMDSFYQTYVVANPWEVALSPDGRRLYIVFSGTNDMFVCRVLDDDYVEVEFLKLLRVGANPRAVRVAPDGSKFYVYNALDFTVDVFDNQSLKRLETIAVTHWPGSEEELLGKRLFYSALPPMSSRKWISCSSCHPDGDNDGRTWQQPEGLRNTQALAGIRETQPIHWSADRDEVQDFEHTIRSALMQGRGLIRSQVAESLGPPNAGRSRELDALAAYANSHTFSLSPFAKQGLSAAARRGKILFESAATGCAECHSGPYLTDRKLHDVGTGQADPTELMGPRYDTPTLLGIYRTGPYLHHGQAETLEEVLTTANRQDRHGRTSQLTPEDVRDLVAYLQALPYEQP
jgi:YVTN family beta-propeller protein